MKVFFQQNIIPNYRIVFFNQLVERLHLDLSIFCYEKLPDNNSDFLFKTILTKPFKWKGFFFPYIFYKIILNERPEIVIAGKPLFILWILCKILHIKLIYFQGGIHYREKHLIKQRELNSKLKRLLKGKHPFWWLLRHADALVVYSKHAKDYYTGKGVNKDKIFVAPNSPDSHLLEKQRKYFDQHIDEIKLFRDKYINKDGKILLMIGRLNHGRKAEHLLQIFKLLSEQLTDISLVIVGEGEAQVNLEELCDDLKLENVHFAGGVYDDNILAKYLVSCDCFIVPLASLALKMAMIFGKPVITGNMGLEVHDIIDTENGYVVDIEDHQDVANKLIKILSDNDLYKQIQKNNFHKMQNEINLDNMVAGFNAAIEYVI